MASSSLHCLAWRVSNGRVWPKRDVRRNRTFGCAETALYAEVRIAFRYDLETREPTPVRRWTCVHALESTCVEALRGIETPPSVHIGGDDAQTMLAT